MSFADDNRLHVMPLIVPADYFTRGMKGPHARLVAPDLALTWVIAPPAPPGAGAMVYMDPATSERWTREGFDYRSAAVWNLRNGDAWTREKRDDSGRLLWVAMMNPDGLGSSRVLLEEELAAAFPEGYRVAFPDRSCGFAVSNGLSREDLGATVDLIERCFRDATTPMLSTLFEPAELHPA
jgi:hypothetical protein